jgi:hypothetical protein
MWKDRRARDEGYRNMSVHTLQERARARQRARACNMMPSYPPHGRHWQRAHHLALHVLLQ